MLYNYHMNTKHTEHTANLAMAQAPAIVAKIGRNFAKPIPRKVAENKKSFLQKLMKLWYNRFLGSKRELLKTLDSLRLETSNGYFY